MSSLRYKLKKLDDKSDESFYWLGFLLADGNFSKQNRLTVTLSIVDCDHVKSLCEFLGSGTVREHGDYCTLSIMDVSTIAKLKEMYGIESNKTYHPPTLRYLLTEHQKFCLMMGFIDGDGSIQYQTGRTDVKLSIKVHESWAEFLSWLFGKTARINNAGYAYIGIADNTILREFKNRALSIELPILKRKWDRVDSGRISRYITSREWFEKAKILKQQGLSINSISQALGIKYITVYQRFERNNYE